MDVVPKHPTRTLVSSVEAFPGPGRRFFSYTWLENEEYYFAIVDAQVPHDIPLGQHLPNETPLDVYSLRGCHLPKNCIFATIPHDLQIAKPEDVQSSDIFIKKPQIVMSDENEDISKMQPITEGLIPEARVYQTLMSVSGGPHPNICRYYGAVETDGFLCGLALQRCRKTLQELKTENAVFDEAFIERVASGLRAALTHLHSINLAHNDINPRNIGLDDEDNAILFDYDACMPIGETLIKTGTPGWGDFDKSSMSNDKEAYEKVILWMRGEYDPNDHIHIDL